MDKHQSYFDTFAQSIALIAENINMQMEAEFADLYDRNMMALYGVAPGKPGRIDMNTKLSSKARPKPYRVEASKSPSNKDLESINYPFKSKRDNS